MPLQKQEQTHQDELHARSMSCGDVPSARKLRTTNSVDSFEAEIIMAAGESRKTDTLEFIEKQRQLFNEVKSKNLSDHQDKDDVIQGEDKAGTTANFDFKVDHFKTTPPNSSVHDGKQIMTERRPRIPDGNQEVKYLSQDTALTYADYVSIEYDAYEDLFSKHKRHGKFEAPLNHSKTQKHSKTTATGRNLANL